MPSIFAVANPKGGSGKTTVAIILAGEFAKHGYSAAIVDADPQGSSYQWHASSVVRGLSPQGVDLVRAPDGSLQMVLVSLGQLCPEPRLASRSSGGASHRRSPSLPVRTLLG